MGTFNAFYVRTAADGDAMVAAIRTKFPAADVEADTEFWGIQCEVCGLDRFQTKSHA